MGDSVVEYTHDERDEESHPCNPLHAAWRGGALSHRPHGRSIQPRNGQGCCQAWLVGQLRQLGSLTKPPRRAARRPSLCQAKKTLKKSPSPLDKQPFVCYSIRTMSEENKKPEVQESTINIEGGLCELMPTSEEFYYDSHCIGHGSRDTQRGEGPSGRLTSGR